MASRRTLAIPLRPATATSPISTPAPSKVEKRRKISRMKRPTKDSRIAQFGGRKMYPWYGKRKYVKAETGPEDIFEGMKSRELGLKEETIWARKAVWRALGWSVLGVELGEGEQNKLGISEEEIEARKVAAKMVGGKVIGEDGTVETGVGEDGRAVC